MARLLITYSLSYDWLVRGRPEGDWREIYERGLTYQAAARAHWEPYDDAVFGAFERCGLHFWEVWPAYPVDLPTDANVNAFKEPLTFPMTEEWDDVHSVLVHELAHLHEDHPSNRPRYEAVIRHIRGAFPDEDEGVQYHLVTCTLQLAVLKQAFPDRWPGMLDRSKGHPILRRTWQIIERRAVQINWQDPLASLAMW